MSSYFKIIDYKEFYFTNVERSSIIKSYVYDEYCNTLVIKFVDNSKYLYSGVPKSIFDRLLMSESKGRFINTYLRKNYPYICISKD
jgi:hypothetical protein